MADEPAEGPWRGRQRGEEHRPVFEGWIDRQVREAIERGEFDGLPGLGKPLRRFDRDGDDWWIRGKLEAEGIRPPLPSSLQLRREREEIQSTLADVTTEDQVREIVDDFNARVRESIIRGSDGPFVYVRTLNVDEVVAEWRRRTRG